MHPGTESKTTYTLALYRTDLGWLWRYALSIPLSPGAISNGCVAL